MHAPRLAFHASALLSVWSQEEINCLCALSVRIHPTGMRGAAGPEVFIFWLRIQFCLNGSVLKATWDRARVTGTFLVMASLFPKSTGETRPQNTHSPTSRVPNIKSKAAPKRQKTQLPEATHLGCSRQPGSQANKHGAGGVKRILHGSCVRRSPERSISFAAGAQGEGKLRLIRRKGGRGEGICGRAKTFVNKVHCNVADERATPGERDPVLRHKSGAAPAESRKSRWHKREENHPLLLPNNSPGPPNTIPSSRGGAARLGGSTAERLRVTEESRAPKRHSLPGFGKPGCIHRAAASPGAEGGSFTSSFWISFVPSSRRVSPTNVCTHAGGCSPKKGKGGCPEKR